MFFITKTILGCKKKTMIRGLLEMGINEIKFYVDQLNPVQAENLEMNLKQLLY